MIPDVSVIDDGKLDAPAPASTSTSAVGLTTVRFSFSTRSIASDEPKRDHAGRRTAGRRRGSLVSFTPKDPTVGCSSPRAQYAVLCAGHILAQATFPQGTHHFPPTSLPPITELNSLRSYACNVFMPVGPERGAYPSEAGGRERHLLGRQICSREWAAHS